MSSEPTTKGPRRSIRIGKYEVVSHIATGGMGAVYKARNTESGEEVALKVLSPELATKPAMVERFRREAKHSLKLHHENIVTLHEFCEAQSTYFLVMEFVDGIDLHDYSKRKGPLDPDEALEFILQSCKALDHAYQQGVIHRDIKPSNFLVTQQGERAIVKLTDFGLAREASNEEFRVTRAGTTIGTLDYMSPEQARDSGLADVRSDLYSLGATWYHLLAGHAPFPKGGLGERLHRIMHEEPPDVRKFNPRVSSTMASIVHRLMAKEPSQRYQTPADLMHALEALKRGEKPMTREEALKCLAEESGESAAPSRKKKKASQHPKAKTRRTPRSSPAQPRPDTKSSKSTAEVPNARTAETTPSHLWYLIAGATAIILIIVLAVALSLRRRHREDLPIEQMPDAVSQAFQPDNQDGRTDNQVSQTGKPDLRPLPSGSPLLNPNTIKPPSDSAPNTVPPKKPKWPTLNRSSQPVQAAALRAAIEAPWASVPPSGPTVELIVGRLPPDPSGKTFRSLTAACQAIPVGGTGIIELRDNGPFFDISTFLADRSIILRAAAGYHPLLVWDVQRTLEERRRSADRRDAGPPGRLVFMEVKHGNLTLQDIHVALKWPDAPSENAALLHIEDGDLTLRGCTFSVAGKPRDGLTLARLTATKPETGRCRFERCYARGAKISVLDMNAPGGQVLFDSCLLVGDDAPLVRVQVAEDRPSRVRAVRSTMICGKNLLELRPAKPTDHDPAFDWMGWDVLLSRNSREASGELLRLSGDISTRHLSWRAINCLYAGWSNFITGTTTIPANDLAEWRRLWGGPEGDGIQSDPWPTAVIPEPGEAPARMYRTDDSPVAFAASTDANELLGCDLSRLAPARDNWLSLTFDRYGILAPAVPEEPDPPAIPVAGDGLFHGAAVDLTRTDLGAYLQTVQKNFRLAPEVVLRLSGNGEHLTTPLRIKGSNVVLYFEPPQEKKEPLVLAPAGRGPAEALFDVEQGNLSIINGNLRFSEATEGRVLPWLIKMRRGDLRLFRTHLEVPPKDSGSAFRGLIALEGSSDSAPEHVYSCLANECVLVSARDALAIEGIGARVLLTQTLLIVGGDAIHLALDPDFTRKASSLGGTGDGPGGTGDGPGGTGVSPVGGKANVQCLLDHTTVAARGGFLHLPDVKQAGPPGEPVIVQSHDCGFVNLFPGRIHRPS
ncbi:MAG TPA: protein kinase, partial [Gemmataceae bacterium]|nr:protein kinase [Gemmataceae bacterium]